ncbi:MAG: hypothetical protein GXP55_09255 [Deltaproteobacteria bacterium]|nr:hypothetical protein [Deltaproteobacteria bacterium]
MVALLFVSTLSGCYSWVPIRTTETPLLNNMHVTQVGSAVGTHGESISINEVSVRSLHRPDGRTVRIAGEPGLRVNTTAGAIDFDDPVISSLQPGQSLTVAGSNRSAVTIPLDQIELVEAHVYSPGKTTGLWLAILLSASVATTVAAFAAIN